MRTVVRTIFLVLGVTAAVAGANAIAAGRWTASTPMDEGRAQLGAAAIGDQIYVAGGASLAGPVASFDSFDTVSEAWRPLPPLPEGIQSFGIAAVGDVVVISGGFSSKAPNKPSARTWVYDTHAAQWRKGMDMPGARAGHALVTLGGKAYAVGGRGVDARRIYGYDVVTDTWSASAASLGDELTGHAAVALANRVYVVGGKTSAGRATSDVLVLDPVGGGAVSGPRLPAALSGHAAAVLAGQIHVAGGAAPPEMKTSTAHYVLDPSRGAWQEAAPLLGPRQGLASAAVGGRWFLIGGSAGSGFFSAFTAADAVEIFRPN